MTIPLQEEKSIQKSISKELTNPGPDLHLIVQMVPSGKGFSLNFYLYSLRGANKYNHKKFGDVLLPEGPQEEVQKYYVELSKMARRDPKEEERSDAEARLNSIGKTLWKKLIPKEFKDEYWKFCSHTRSLLITSDEPWIPWEIIKPYDDTRDEPFWCQKFALSRWLTESANTETLQLGMVIPVGKLNTNLVHYNEEMEFLENLNSLHNGLDSKKRLHKYLDVLTFLEKENFSIMHFTCHGNYDEAAPSKSPIELSDRVLEPSDINTKFGGSRCRPLVFINACHTGRTGSSLTWLGGWPVCLVNEAQVGAFIGAMWEVNDQLAVQFVKEFYIALLRDKMPIAEAFRIARETIRKAKPYNSSWLAYVLYADPDAMMIGF